MSFLRRVLVLIFVFTAPSSGAEDFQVRLLAHRPPCDATVRERPCFGPVAWMVAPDVTVRPAKVLAVAGIGRRTESGWVELMGGRFFTDSGRPQNVMNFRALLKRGSGTRYFDVMYRDPHGLPRAYRPWLVSGFATIRIAGRLSAGVENDLLFGPHAPPSLGIGPRVAFTKKKFSLALGWQFRNRHGGENFVRSYTLQTF